MLPGEAYVYVHDGCVFDAFVRLHAAVECSGAEEAVLLPFSPRAGSGEKGIAEKLDSLMVNGFDGAVGIQVTEPCKGPDECVGLLVELADELASTEFPAVVSVPYPGADYPVAYGTALRLGYLPVTEVSCDEGEGLSEHCDRVARVAARNGEETWEEALEITRGLLRRREGQRVGFAAAAREAALGRR